MSHDGGNRATPTTDHRHSDGSTGGSRPSMTNRHGHGESLRRQNLDVSPEDLPDGVGLRPISVEPGRKLRKEAVHELSDGLQSRPTYAVVGEWRDWYQGYNHSNMEWVSPEGETCRSKLENSYQPQYGKRYYAKLKDFERGVERRETPLTTTMLTFTCSDVNAEGHKRCPADHMRDIMDGFNAARKQLHKILDVNWEYARVWEPHESGYGHMHMALFIEADRGDIEPAMFEPAMRSHVNNCKPAGWDAHKPEPDSDDSPVSVNSDVENLGSYISEYIGTFGEETLSRPLSEQMFYSVCWATGTQRVTFSNGAQEIMRKEQFRRETGLTPGSRGGQSFEEWKEPDSAGNASAEYSNSDESTTESVGDNANTSGWEVSSICTVVGTVPEYSDPTTGGVDMEVIDGRPGMDPPPVRD